MAKARHPLPAVDDPLSEPTLNRRLWAAYLRANYTRRTFSEALGTSYAQLSHWDAGRQTMQLAYVRKAALILCMSTDDLIFGRDAERPGPYEPPPHPQGEVDHAMVRTMLDAMDAAPETRERLALHLESPSGRYQHVTQEYVRRFVQVYELERAKSATPEHAVALAYTEAINHVATVSASRLPLAAPARPRKVPPRLATTRSTAH